MDFGKKGFNALRDAMKVALKSVEEEFDIRIDPGSIKYSVGTATIKVEIKKNSVDGKSCEQAEFNKLCTGYGLGTDHYGAEVILTDGTKAKIHSIFRRRRKYPIGVQTTAGKVFLMTARQVRHQLGIELNEMEEINVFS